MQAIYDTIGRSYVHGRRTDPVIAKKLHAFLVGASKVLNIGAGTGSYEPVEVDLVALEPSEVMIEQRASDAAPVIQGFAEELPFADNEFSHCMAVLSMHHWSDLNKAFSEIKRVTRERFVALTWTPDYLVEKYWLYRDYLSQVPDLNRSIFPSADVLREYFTRVDEHVVMVPHDCADGFDGSYWRRPHAFLDPEIRNNMSVFSKIENVDVILQRLADDLESGKWHTRNADILKLKELDVGYRIFVATV